MRWHRAGFRRYWRWKSRSLGSRPKIAADIARVDPQMSAEIRCGVRRASMASCSSSASRSLSRAPRSTWSGDLDCRPDRAPSCVATRRASPPWTCRCSEHWLRSALCLRHSPAGPPRNARFRKRPGQGRTFRQCRFLHIVLDPTPNDIYVFDEPGGALESNGRWTRKFTCFRSPTRFPPSFILLRRPRAMRHQRIDRVLAILRYTSIASVPLRTRIARCVQNLLCC